MPESPPGRMARLAGFEGQIVFDRSKPDGTPRKLTDSSRLLGMGWHPRIDLDDGLTRTIREFEGQRLADAPTISTSGTSR